MFNIQCSVDTFLDYNTGRWLEYDDTSISMFSKLCNNIRHRSCLQCLIHVPAPVRFPIYLYSNSSVGRYMTNITSNRTPVPVHIIYDIRYSSDRTAFNKCGNAGLCVVYDFPVFAYHDGTEIIKGFDKFYSRYYYYITYFLRNTHVDISFSSNISSL